MKKILSLVLFIGLILCLAGCFGDDDNGDLYTVAVLATEGIEVGGDNPVKVKKGEDAVFTISHDNKTVVDSVSAGNYDYTTKTLTVKNVTDDMRIAVNGVSTEYDSSVISEYKFMAASEADTSTKPSGSYSLGVSITVYAGNEDLAFVGWSFGDTLEYGGTMLTMNREYTFTLTPGMLIENTMSIYPNYSEQNVLLYNVNGGMIDVNAGNMTSDYYKAECVDSSGTVLKVSLEREYFDATGCASTFYDDGIFAKHNHLLTEYNTEPDGSGESYSIGSKFPLNRGITTLYCIWTEVIPTDQLELELVRIPLPKGVSPANAPHWTQEGWRVVSYKGDAETVAVPAIIGEIPVISIAEGAFSDKSMETLVMGRYIVKVDDGAFKNCSNLKTIYYPDGIYHISNDAFDETSWSGVKNFYVNATLAPRFSQSLEGAYAFKLTRLLYYSDKKQIIVIAGSSAFQGLSSQYLETLLDGEYNVVNFGTTRTTQGYMYLEAMGYYADENDIVLFAPENSAYMMGEPRLYWKTLRDMEGMYNIFRHIDISNYDNVIGAFAEFNRGNDPESYETLTTGRYFRAPSPYEAIIDASNINVYGEYQYSEARGDYVNDAKYQDVYKLTLNERFKSIKEGAYMNSDPNEDYNTSPNWCDITDPYYRDNMNRAIRAAKAGGAKVYFTFCPVDGLKLSDEAKAGGSAWFAAYDSLILNNYVFDGLLGKTENYIYNHQYFYNNAFHLNDYGRTYRTYDMYLDLAELLGIEQVHKVREFGVNFEGCLFERTEDGLPRYKAEEHYNKQ